jgi:carbon-monoxide dehydrogenase medium subunit
VVLVPDLADLLRGRPLDPATIDVAVAAASQAAQPIDDLRAPASYRAELVATMTRRAFETLAADGQADRWPTDAPRLWGAGFDGTYPTGPDYTTDVAVGDAITTEVNGVTVTAPGAAGVTLLDWLRDEAGLCGAKEGCAEGECGACTIDLDGASVLSCLVPAARAHASRIVTVEGLADAGELHPIQRAFVDANAVQCGYCTPGLLMASAKLLEELSAPDDDQVRRGLAGNLCRCTGYRAIEAAVAQVAVEGRA